MFPNDIVELVYLQNTKPIPSQILKIEIRGAGVYPDKDHKGRPLDRLRASKAGKRIAGPYTAILDGFEGDQDFMRLIFLLTRGMLRIRKHGVDDKSLMFACPG